MPGKVSGQTSGDKGTHRPRPNGSFKSFLNTTQNFSLGVAIDITYKKVVHFTKKSEHNIAENENV